MSSITFKTTNVEDTFIENDAPNSNLNGDTHLYIGELDVVTNEITRTLIKFPLDNGLIPANSTINTATLRLYKMTDYASIDTTASVYRVRRAWIDNQATWNSYTTGNTWTTAGASSVLDREAGASGTRVFVNGEGTGAFADFTLTPSMIQDMIVGGTWTNNGFLIKTATEADDGWEFASNANLTTANHAELVVDYTAPTASPSGLSTNKGYW